MPTRRAFMELCGGAIVASSHRAGAAQTGPAHRLSSLNGWLFGENETQLSPVTLPHCVARLSWRDWDPSAWEKIWLYRCPFPFAPEFRNRRVFLEFDGVMVGASPVINGHALPARLGGYLPFRYEITPWLRDDANVLDVTVDSRWQNVPPEGSPRGPVSIDYLEPGGIVRDVHLRAVPQVFISDVFAKPVNVLDSRRRVDLACTVNAAAIPGKAIRITAELRDGARVISRTQGEVEITAPGETQTQLALSRLRNIELWHVDSPHLYDVVTTLSIGGRPIHEYRVRIGLRDARFDLNGFFLNGRRLQLFGLNRHELFPYVGVAMPTRAMRRDAEILRREFNCNIVRCSHYPQSEAFLDACDELGLMVWEEIPGWQYIGDEAWQELAVRDVGDMVRRDRNHPAIVIWGVRINESKNDPPLYERTRELAYSLDGSRPTSGSMTRWSTENWHQDVFAFDDYHAAPDGSVAIREPLPGVPYLLAEAVGQFNYSTGKKFDAYYRRSGDVATQQLQAIRHAQAHDRAASYPRCAGVIAWCGFEYGSLMNAYRAVKQPGVADTFRIPKLGAAFYQAQVSPEIRAVIIPNFYWDFGPECPNGPGKNAAIFSNCDRLEVFIDRRRYAVVTADRAGFPHLRYPPFFCDLAADGAAHPELRIDAYVGNKLALSRSFSSDRRQDRFLSKADDDALAADGSDATRLVFMTTDVYGTLRPFNAGEVSFQLTGPGIIVGDNPFNLADGGGAGAVWIRTLRNSTGLVRVTATHSRLGVKSVTIAVRQAAP